MDSYRSQKIYCLHIFSPIAFILFSLRFPFFSGWCFFHQHSRSFYGVIWSFLLLNHERNGHVQTIFFSYSEACSIADVTRQSFYSMMWLDNLSFLQRNMAQIAGKLLRFLVSPILLIIKTLLVHFPLVWMPEL